MDNPKIIVWCIISAVAIAFIAGFIKPDLRNKKLGLISILICGLFAVCVADLLTTNIFELVDPFLVYGLRETLTENISVVAHEEGISLFSNGDSVPLNDHVWRHFGNGFLLITTAAFIAMLCLGILLSISRLTFPSWHNQLSYIRKKHLIRMNVTVWQCVSITLALCWLAVSSLLMVTLVREPYLLWSLSEKSGMGAIAFKIIYVIIAIAVGIVLTALLSYYPLMWAFPRKLRKE
jgi:hypothetical protein